MKILKLIISTCLFLSIAVYSTELPVKKDITKKEIKPESVDNSSEDQTLTGDDTTTQDKEKQAGEPHLEKDTLLSGESVKTVDSGKVIESASDNNSSENQALTGDDTLAQSKGKQEETSNANNDTLLSIGKSEITDSSKVSESKSDKDTFENPFLNDDETITQGEEKQKETKDSSGNLFIAEVETETQKDSYNEENNSIDIIVDLAVGVSLPRFEVKPNTISSEGKPNFIFSSGIIIPFAKWFYAGISLRYLQFYFIMSEFDTAYTSINAPMYQEKEAKESFTFISAPIQLGMRFTVGPMTPYFYLDFEPAYMVAGYQNSKKKVTTFFLDSTSQVNETIKDFGTTDKRNQFQPFFGGGIGLEISYGYGSVYFDASLQYSPLDIDKNIEDGSFIKRTSCRVLYIPINLGIRFFL